MNNKVKTIFKCLAIAYSLAVILLCFVWGSLGGAYALLDHQLSGNVEMIGYPSFNYKSFNYFYMDIEVFIENRSKSDVWIRGQDFCLEERDNPTILINSELTSEILVWSGEVRKLKIRFKITPTQYYEMKWYNFKLKYIGDVDNVIDQFDREGVDIYQFDCGE